MFSLAASISASVAVSVLLKVARKQNIQVDQAIAVNYPTAALLCLILLRPEPSQVLAPGTPWWVLLALGVLLPGIFLAMAGAVRHAGIVVSDAAQRLSLLLPLAASFLFFGESAGPAKLAGMAVALAALGCLIWQPRRQTGNGLPPTASSSIPAGAALDSPVSNLPETTPSGPATANANTNSSARADTGTGMGMGTDADTDNLHFGLRRARARTLALLLCVWAGYGTIDILFKQMARSAIDFSSSLFVAFVLAGLAMAGWLFARRTQWRMRSMAAGVLLGLLNFANIYFYLRAHQQYPDNPTLVFAAMNIGVIGLGTLVGSWAFKESLPPGKIAGLALAVAAIGLLLPR